MKKQTKEKIRRQKENKEEQKLERKKMCLAGNKLINFSQ